MGNLKKTKSGIVAILANYGTPEMRKVIDIKITNGYPTVTIPKDFELVLPQRNQSLKGYQHITIPPDLNIHITGSSKPKIWSDGFDGLLSKAGNLTKPCQKLITVVLPPITDFPIFTERQYQGAMIIAFQQMPHWSENTGFVLEIFAHKEEHTQIPKEVHYAGDLGAYMPWHYSTVGKTYDEDYKRGDFYIRQFAITNHGPKPQKIITVYFGDFQK